MTAFPLASICLIAACLLFALHLDQRALKRNPLPNDFKLEASGSILKSA